MSGRAGAYLIAWRQLRVNGVVSGPASQFQYGASVQWTGDAIELSDCPMSSPGALERALCKALPRGRFLDGTAGEEPYLGELIHLTDGMVWYRAHLVHIPELAQPLVLFLGDLPDVGVDLALIDPGFAPQVAAISTQARRRTRRAAVGGR